MKNRSLLYFTFFVFISGSLFGQTIKQHSQTANGETFIYYAMEPVSKVSGILVLLPAIGELPQTIFNETALPRLMAEKGYITVIPKLRNTLFLDQYAINQIDQLLKTQFQRYGVSDFVIGGRSVGGSVAIGYAEHLLASGNPTSVKAVFSVDGPLDLKRLYASTERRTKFSCAISAKNARVNLLRLEKALGGSPVAKSSQYVLHSAYSSDEADGGNAKYLGNMPIRLYSEPDLDYMRKTHCKDWQFNDINAFDADGLNKFLVKHGNRNSEYIATAGKGSIAGIWWMLLIA